MERLKKSKTVLWLSDVLRVRPIVFAALLVLFADLIYVNFIFSYPAVFDLNGQNTVIEGKIRKIEYDENGFAAKVVIGDTLCYVNGYLLSKGDTIRVKGLIAPFEPLSNIGEFDQRRYYAASRVFYHMYADDVELIKHSRFLPTGFFPRFRKKLAERVMDYCPYEGGTVNTLLLGDKTFLSKERKDLYSRAGVAHFLVISGLHISAVGTFIYRLLLHVGIKKRKACIAAFAFLTAYGILTGFGISVIRAVVMFGVRLLADIAGRTYDMMNSLSLALIVTVFINPLSILDTAFAYSYSTVFAIALYSVYIHPKAYRRDGFLRRLREYFRIPVILCLFVMPVTLRLSYSYSLFSILINAVLAPLSGPILFIGACCLLTSAFRIEAAAVVFETVLHGMLSFIDSLCEAGTKLSCFTLLGRPSWLKLVIYYLLLLVYFFYVKENEYLFNKCLYLLLAVLFVGETFGYVPKVSMLYVGQGECIVIRTGRESAVMIDCGSSSEKEIGKYTVVPFLKASGIKALSSLIVTHPDTDHISGINELLDETESGYLRIDRLVVPDTPFTKNSEEMDGIIRRACSNRIPVTLLKRGTAADYGVFDFVCLSPSKSRSYSDVNDSSIVLKARLLGTELLFTGDISSETECALLMNTDVSADILKVAHHGSNSSSSKEFLKASGAGKAIISAGRNNRYHHPAGEVAKRLEECGIEWYCTKYSGMLEVIFGKVFCPCLD